MFKTKKKCRPQAKLVAVSPKKRPGKRLSGYSYTYWVLQIPKEKGETEAMRRRVPQSLRPGEQGVTRKWIDLLYAMDREERLKMRYGDEKKDLETEAKKANILNMRTDPVETLPDSSFAPEAQLFQEKLPKSISNEELQKLIEVCLQPQQKELIYQYYVEQIPQATIAKAAGVSSAAIAHKRERICKKLKKKFGEIYKIYTYQDLKCRGKGQK